MAAKSADPFANVEPLDNLADLAGRLQHCRRCPIGCNGTRAVAGEGPAGAPLMIVGEQPGDVEEREGRPFVGPAGRLLMQQLEEAGIERDRAFVTNAVKHFKFSPRGKRRIHETPTAREIDICRWWLESERRLVRPRLILALGASAARGMLGKTVSIGTMRGRLHRLDDGTGLWISTHPSYLLRLRDEKKTMESARFAEDIQAVEKQLRAG